MVTRLSARLEDLRVQLSELRQHAGESEEESSVITQTWVRGLEDLRRMLDEIQEGIQQGAERAQAYLDLVGVIIVAVGLDERVTLINKRGCAILGYSEHELIGRNWFEFIPEHVRARARGWFRRILAGAVDGTLHAESLVRTRAGQERTIAWHNSVVHDEHGQIVGTLSSGEDITERKQAEGQRDRLAHAVEQAGEAVIITDAEGTIQYVNAAFERITGWPRREVLGQNPRILKSGKQERTLYERMWETLKAGQVWHGRMVNKRRDGTFYEEDSTISPILDAAGQIVSYVEVQRDVTQQVELEGRLRQAEKMEAIGRLAGGVAHDFNNQLTVIKGYADVLLGDLPEGSPVRESVQEIRRAAERSATLTSQLLAFSRKQMLYPRVVNLNTVVGEMARTLGRMLGEQVQLAASLAEGLGEAEVDPGQLEQAVMNLALNARDAMPGGGVLTIETTNVALDEPRIGVRHDAPPGQYVMLAVTDTGMGMDQETLRRVFEPFYTTKPAGRGTGLGLAMVHGFVRQSGGHITVYSEPGHGTTFRIYLPRVAAGGAAPSPEEQPEPLLHPAETILVVEDEEAVRSLVVRLLQERGWHVLAAAGADEALAVSERHEGRIDLLISDVVMPLMQGPELAAVLKAARPEMKVMYITGYAQQAAERELAERGAVVLAKPFSPAELSRRIRQLLYGDK